MTHNSNSLYFVCYKIMSSTIHFSPLRCLNPKSHQSSLCFLYSTMLEEFHCIKSRLIFDLGLPPYSRMLNSFIASSTSSFDSNTIRNFVGALKDGHMCMIISCNALKEVTCFRNNKFLHCLQQLYGLLQLNLHTKMYLFLFLSSFI